MVNRVIELLFEQQPHTIAATKEVLSIGGDSISRSNRKIIIKSTLARRQSNGFCSFAGCVGLRGERRASNQQVNASILNCLLIFSLSRAGWRVVLNFTDNYHAYHYQFTPY